MFRFLALCSLALFSTISWSQSLVVSTQPIYLIAKTITQGVEQPTLLLANQSGHDVSLTPAHRKTIQDAGLVIWLGQAHEAPLAKVLEESNKSIAILDSSIINPLPMRNPRGEALKNTVDTHVWLDPNNAVRIGFFIAALRSQQMPQYRETYWKNARAFAQNMLTTAQRYSSTSKPRPYWSYHDAYQYLERPLNLKFMGALTDDPHVSPTVAQIKYLQDTRAQTKMCLLAEGHANANQYRKLNPVVFQHVDESMSGAGDFIQGWQQLADQTNKCVLNSR
ncbi:high affinity Zn ABC transporter periplasmic substrate-binding protein [Acinetobacter sp. HA]|uniref:metal ABC transporter solute-binding protein, Zn/Mn family n=1 Tax=Acinetobacter sp. HA TaxID=1173062 RepID=UPI000263DDCD|nr:zinc ABC transporter substrate-binding protein [Acinetobacter sp. HA]EIM38255.1 high affinity Zn ABC transporter periplasmic substrate-binding protein [Acinetobacter sp. HA]